MRHQVRVGDAARIGGLAPQAGQDLVAHAADRVGVEARLVERKPQQIEALLLAVAQQPDRAEEIVVGDREAQLGGVVLEPLMERLGVEFAGAVVEQRRRPCSRRPACRSGPGWRRRRRRSSAPPAAATARCTSQASMPPGDTTRWIVVALRGLQRQRGDDQQPPPSTMRSAGVRITIACLLGCEAP